ncbi:extracellular solute-binding protein [Paenibacillus sp. FSL R5-0527]|uniref:ABC transporter substrate-binding protein n=1 Tax=Paenibacillus sp. FSL R5-0527 TaxID=2975321 RepID=UPI00097B0FF1|nr:hypothetical protein BK140_27075 [Paenibacillus macerans]
MNLTKVRTAISVCLMLLLCACAGNPTNSSELTDRPVPETGSPSEQRIKLTLMIASAEDANAKLEEELVSKHFADQYDITFKIWEAAYAEREIKTSVASGEALDLVMYWPTQMKNLVNGNLALDLTPYLEANNGEWKTSFLDGALNTGTYNGRVYAVPSTPVYPVLEVNKDILDQVGVDLPDGPMSWAEFKNILSIIKEKAGIAPLGLQKDWASWTVRELFYSVWPDEQKLLAWSKGQIAFTDPTIVNVFNEVKELYDKEYVYPGKGALTTTLDQVNTAFQSGKIAIKADLNSLVKQSIKDSGLRNVEIISWPHMGTRTKVLGGYNGYMIPINAKHPAASVEVLKYLTSAEVLQHRVNSGAPVMVKGVIADDPHFAEYSKDIGKMYKEPEMLSLSPSIADYMGNNMPANFLFYGMDALKELDMLRQEAIQHD